jgi:hypothetical protein
VGAVLIAGPASAGTTYSCSPYFSCSETDEPGQWNSAGGSNMPNLVDTGVGKVCLAPYYSNTGSVEFWGKSWRAGTNVLQEVRWRLWWSADPAMTNEEKAFKQESPEVPHVVVTVAPGYFRGCVVNYESGAPPVDFGIVVAQHA